MAQITVEEVYNGTKYAVMSLAVAEYLKEGRPSEYDERTWLDLLLVKHALITAEKMKIEGDSIHHLQRQTSLHTKVRSVRVAQVAYTN